MKPAAFVIKRKEIETDSTPNTKEAAAERQKILDEKKAVFKAAGGKIEKLPNWVPRESDRITKKKETRKQELVRKVSACLGYSREAFVYLRKNRLYCSQKILKRTPAENFIGRFTEVSQAKKFEI